MIINFDISPLEHDLDAEINARIDSKTKPIGALGRLEELALQVGRIQRTVAPQLVRPQVLLFAGDHGAVAAGVSAYPQDVTWQMVLNFLQGGAAINVFARQLGLAVQVIDAGVNHDFDDIATHAALRSAKIAHGTRNFVHEPAMTLAQCENAIEQGAMLVRESAEQGCNVIALGEMGIGNTAAAAMLVHRLGELPLTMCVGRGTGLDDAGLVRKREVLARASARRPGTLTPLEVLSEYGGFEIAMMVGAYLAAAQARMLILVDGFIASSALLVAARLHPAVREYCVFAHNSAENGHRALLELLQARPLLDLDMRLGEGTGAALCYPLVQAAVNFLGEMASFAQAGVAEKGG